MSADDDHLLTDDNARGPDAPAVVLPGAGATTTQGIGSGAGTYSGAPVIPAFVDSSDATSTDSATLADRIEEVLAEDGRFQPLLSGLTFAADDSGRVTVSGRLPNSALRGSLLATLHAVPGVTGVTDDTR